MKIKVVSIQHENVWYKNEIGKIFEVNSIKDFYVFKKNPFYKFFKEDCEKIKKVEAPESSNEEIN